MKARASFASAPTASAGAGVAESDGVAAGDSVADAAGDSLGDWLGDWLGESVGLGDVESSAPNAGRFFGVALSLAPGSVDEDAEGDAAGDGGSVTPTPGSALGLAVALGSVDGAAVPQGPGAALEHATVRKRSCACRLTVSTSELSVSPGISTTMYLLPWVVTSASATPVPLTRLSMMEAASSRFSFVGS